jgi:hypothetical protein
MAEYCIIMWTSILAAYAIAFPVVNEAANRHDLEQGRDKGGDQVRQLLSLPSKHHRQIDDLRRSYVCIYKIALHSCVGNRITTKPCYMVAGYHKVSEEHITSNFCPEDGGNLFLRNVGNNISDYKLS